MTLREFIEMGSRLSGQRFDKTGSVAPMYHYINGDGQDIVVVAPMLDNKDTNVNIMRWVLDKADATRVMFISEGWVLDGPINQVNRERVEREGLRAHPDRVEVLMIMAEDEKEGQMMATRIIMRDGDSRPRLGPLEFKPTTGSAEGRLIGLLPRKKFALLN